MAAGDIDIYADLRRKPKSGPMARGGGRPRMMVEFRCPDIRWDVSDRNVKTQLGVFAKLLQTTARVRLLSGRDFAGRPLPTAAAATVERRRYRMAQAARGGQAHERYIDQRFRGATVRNFNRRFNAARLGHFSPKGGSMFGRESDMLAWSITVAPVASGSWGLFVANARGLIGSDGDSAIGRFVRRVGAWSQEAMRHPTIQEGLRNLQRGLRIARGQRLGGVLRALRSSAAELAEQAETLGDVDAAQAADVG